MGALKNLFERVFEPRKHTNELGFQFVMAELEIGLMFCRLALGTVGTQCTQYRVNARSAYESAIWHVKTLTLTSEEHQAFENKECALRIGIESM